MRVCRTLRLMTPTPGSKNTKFLYILRNCDCISPQNYSEHTVTAEVTLSLPRFSCPKVVRPQRKSLIFEWLPHAKVHYSVANLPRWWQAGRLGTVPRWQLHRHRVVLQNGTFSQLYNELPDCIRQYTGIADRGSGRRKKR